VIGLVDLLERLGASLVDLLGVVVVDLLLSSDPLTAVTLAAGLALWTVAFGVATVSVVGSSLPSGAASTLSVSTVPTATRPDRLQRRESNQSESDRIESDRTDPNWSAPGSGASRRTPAATAV
jgi:hypothetical protein